MATTSIRSDRRDVRTSVLAGSVGAVTILVLGLVRIGRSYGYDEAFTYTFFVDGGSVRRALTTQVVFNNHPMFSATQAVAWRLGLTSEAAQRLGPLLCAAVTVGVVVWYVTRRVGPVGGAAAGVVLALNPLYLEQIRQLRGYSLATMTVLLAAIAMQRSWHDDRTRWLVAQGACMVVAVTTHAYSAVTILAVAVAALVLGRVRLRHVVTWVTSALIALVITAPLIDDIRANTSARGNRYVASFPVDLVRLLTGWETVAVVLTLAAMTVGAVGIGRRSHRSAGALAAAVGVVAVVVLVVWQVLQPFDLYGRFFISAMPFVAILAGLGVGRLPGLASGAITVALVLVLAPAAVDLLETEPTIREAAEVTNRARALDLRVCGSHAEPLRAYTDPMPLLSGLDGFGGCDVFVSVLPLTSAQRSAATEWYSGEAPLGGGVIVWADERVLPTIVDASGT